jgi:long-chain acyl-CoA synthetase
MSRVGLIGDNSIEYICTLIDIWNNGDCAVLIDWRIPNKTAIELMCEASVEKCYIELKFFKNFEDCTNKDISLIFYVNNTNAGKLLPESVYTKFHEDYSSNEAVVIYSSGTTGKSKGIILSHFAINTNADAIIDYINPKADDCMYIVKTMSHSSTITGEVLVALKTKIKLLVTPVIVPPRYILNNISKYKITIICMNPTILKMLTEEVNKNKEKYDLTSLRELYVHGAKTDKKRCESARQTFINTAVYYEYGLSEAGPRVSTQKLSSNCIDSVGKPVRGVEVAIIKEDGSITESNERGIIHVKSPSRYIKYIKGISKFKSLYNDWLNTGDVGFWDEYGELHIVDRTDDVIILDAHKIYPSDVERAILESTAAAECVVTEYLSDSTGTLSLGCVYVSNRDLSVEDNRKLGKVLSAYEIPKRYLRVNELPKNRNGKILRSEAAKLLK